MKEANMNCKHAVIVALALLLTSLRLTAQTSQLKTAIISAGAARLDNGSLVNIGQPLIGVMAVTDGSASVSSGLLPALLSAQGTNSLLIIYPTLTMQGGQFQFAFPTQPGRNYVVQVSTNLLDWSPVWTNVGTWTELLFADAETGVYQRRFYRVEMP
jgi:hypothetical protein